MTVRVLAPFVAPNAMLSVVPTSGSVSVTVPITPSDPCGTDWVTAAVAVLMALPSSSTDQVSCVAAGSTPSPKLEREMSTESASPLA